ncbi:MAG: glycoside hydrolase family 15 protein [Roseiarcus sp.]
MIEVHHDEVRRRLKSRYTREDVREWLSLLDRAGALRFTPLPSGLYPAANLSPRRAAASGYGAVWVRDNVYVALAHATAKRNAVADRVVSSLAEFYAHHSVRFTEIIDGVADPNDAMKRPHIRFDGSTATEIAGKWAHAQNDALGYFLWLYCRRARARRTAPDFNLLRLFVRYFQAIRFWQDEDSGHWEEARKVSASSLGVVVAALREARRLLVEAFAARGPDAKRLASTVEDLVARGEGALRSILPFESIGPGADKVRRYDSALLFLVHPLEVVDGELARELLADIGENLQGDYGIKRYLGDSYWTADYKRRFPLDRLTADFSVDHAERDALARPGEEAQWSLFDPILSIAAGRLYLNDRRPEDLERQVVHLNRSLGQLTGPDCRFGELRCPEAYYLEDGAYVVNDHVPLLWTQANLWMALLAMDRTLAGAQGGEGGARPAD